MGETAITLAVVLDNTLLLIPGDHANLVEVSESFHLGNLASCS